MLLRTLAAQQHWLNLQSQVERSGANSLHSLNLFFRPPLLNAAGDDSLSGVQLYCAVGLLTWFSAQENSPTWLDQLTARQ